MDVIIESLWPTFALIVLGALFRRGGFPGDEFWAPAVRLAYFVLLPTLIVRELANAPLGELNIGPMSGALVLAILAVTLGLIFGRRWLGLDHRPFGSVVQASIRFNTYIALATATSLVGTRAGAPAALAIAVITPLVNLISVGVLLHSPDVALPGGRLGKALVTNPLVIACGIGLLLNGTGVGLPEVSVGVIDLLARAALPIGLLTVGAGLSLEHVHPSRGPIVLASGLKLLVLPTLVATFCTILAVDSTARAIAVLFAAMPTGPAGYALARQLGGDAELLANILTMQTLLAAVTIPLVWLILA